MFFYEKNNFKKILFFFIKITQKKFQIFEANFLFLFCF